MNSVVKTVRSKIQDRKDIIAIAKQEIDDLTRVCVDVEAFCNNFAFDPLYEVDNDNGRDYLASGADFTAVRQYKEKDGDTTFFFVLVELENSVYQVIVHTNSNFVSFPIRCLGDDLDNLFEQALNAYIQIKFGL